MNVSTTILPEEYLSCEVAQKTTYKSIRSAYERNEFSVIKRGSIFYIEGYGCSDRTYHLLIKEVKRIYPNLTYLHDI